jgi:hypothetical protein
MDYHIDRRVILNQDSEFKNLYKWSLQEFDADGKKLGSDQIPWNWHLYFTASELTVSDTITLEPNYRHASEETKVIAREIPSDCEISPPRLGDVVEVELYFRRLSKLGKARPETSEEAENATHSVELPEELNDGAGHVQAIHGLTAAVARAVHILSSVRIAAWIIASLLLLILITKP